MHVKEAARKAVEEHGSLIDAQAAVCEIHFKLLPIPSYREILLEVEHAWHAREPVSWPSWPLRHEMAALIGGQQEFHNYVMAEPVPLEEDDGRAQVQYHLRR